MTTKEQIKAEIDNLKDGDLDELYKLIQDFIQSKSAQKKASFMARMRELTIDAPEDFSEHWEKYISGEKPFE